MYEVIIEDLAKAYYLFKNSFKNTPYEDFYGLRDFYHLIKYVAKNLSLSVFISNADVIKIIKRAIDRNFGG